MLPILEEIFATGLIRANDKGEMEKVNSHISKEQGVFLQEMFDLAKPVKSLEVGLAFGISTLFILEKHRQYNAKDGAHIVIEPFPWGDTAAYTFRNANLAQYVDIRNDLSDVVIPQLYHKNERIQYAYVDTTKLFDVVMQDVYFIDKILDIGGIIILDDCDTPGINKVARVLNGFPHYKMIGKLSQSKKSGKYRFFENMFSTMVKLIPFKTKFIKHFSFQTDHQLGLDYRCIAFQKISEDKRNWDWDKPM